MIALSDIPSRVDAMIEDYLAARSAEVCEISPATQQAFELLQQSLRGGKRIRPMFAWVGFTSAPSDEDPEAVLRAITALEFIQSCAIIHDDIIDSSATRRGYPTVHRAIAAHHQTNNWSGNSEHFGIAVAILIGDLALSWADDLLNASGLSAAALARAWEPWRAMRTEVIAGQILDVSAEARGSESVAEAENINLYKTAAYTIARPLHLGAAIANAPANSLLRYGRDIGVAYQLRDDLLGVFGDPAVTGKPAGDDLREGKRTVLLATALQLLDASDPPAAAELRAGMGTPNAAELAGLIRRSGAVEVMEQRIAELTASGLAHLDDSLPEGVTRALHSMAQKATSRHA